MTQADKKTIRHKIFVDILFIALFSVSLSLAFIDHDYYVLSWFAFIPLLLAIEGKKLLTVYVYSVIGGILLFSLSLYWLVGFIELSKGFSFVQSLSMTLIYWLYCGHSIALVSVAYTLIKRQLNISEVLVFPIVLLCVLSFYPMIFDVNMADTQIKFLVAIQAIDTLGTHGLTFMIALSNAFIFTSLKNNAPIKNKNQTQIYTCLVVLCVFIAWFGYGFYALSKWQDKENYWDKIKIGLVQPNEKPSLQKKRMPYGYSYTYPTEIHLSKRLSEDGAKIIFWPEGKERLYLNNEFVKRTYKTQFANIETSIVFQDFIRNGAEYKNMAVMINENGEELGRYAKIKRVPFGEYMPLVSKIDFFNAQAQKILGGILAEITPGTNHHVFEHDKVAIIPLICFETTFPSFVAQAVTQTQSSKPKILLALSNDSWFGQSLQPTQHVMPSILRAVENRMPFIHSVNNGPSIVVAPSGKLLFKTNAFESGGYITEVPYSLNSGGSFYSRNPNWFLNLSLAGFFLMLTYSLIKISKGSKTTSIKKP